MAVFAGDWVRGESLEGGKGGHSGTRSLSLSLSLSLSSLKERERAA